MILPKGNSKKYIKTVIGVYILYVIISPVITTVSGHELKLDYDIYDKYFAASNEYKSVQNDFESRNSKYIENTYKEEIRKQIRKTINDLSYFASNINFDIDLETGKISNLSLSVDLKKKITESNTISINKIEIGTAIKKQEDNNLSKQEIDKIKQKLQEDYGVEHDEIRINSI